MSDRDDRPAGRRLPSVGAGACSACATTGSTACAACAHSVTAVIVTAVAGMLTTVLTVVVPQIFWWRALNPLRWTVRSLDRAGRLSDVSGQELLDVQRAALREVVQARAASDSRPTPE